MKEHWTVLAGRVQRRLVQGGATVELDRDYHVATWYVADGHDAKKAITVVVGPGPVIEDVQMHYAFYDVTPTRLAAIAKAVSACAEAVGDIENMAMANAS